MSQVVRNRSQSVLLPLYAAIKRSGVLETRLGQRLFEYAYDLYKRRIEGAEADALQPFVRPGTLVIDVGANIGFFTRRFARWVSPGGRVIAIEPESANIGRLRQRLADDGSASTVDILQAAVTDVPGPVRLEINAVHPGDHRIGDQGELVDGITLDNLIEARGWPAVSLIKIDIQGAEMRALAGAREVLTRFRPALYVEVDDRNLREFGSSAAELIDALAKIGYSSYRCASSGPIPLDRQDLLREAETSYVDALFLLPSTP